MTQVYPVVLTKDKKGYVVTIPDFDANTQGESLADAIAMARDAMGLMGIDLQDDGKDLPKPGTVEVKKGSEEDVITLVDVDFSAYRRMMDNRSVKKNCTIPYWMNVEAEKAGVNFSKLLQDAIVNVLGITVKKP